MKVPAHTFEASLQTSENARATSSGAAQRHSTLPASRRRTRHGAGGTPAAQTSSIRKETSGKLKLKDLLGNNSSVPFKGASLMKDKDRQKHGPKCKNERARTGCPRTAHGRPKPLAAP